MAKIENVCALCGKSFMVFPSRAHVKYCSKECRNIARSQCLAGKKLNKSSRNNAPKVKSSCLFCGKEIVVTAWLHGKGKGKYCNKKCKANHAKTKVENVCENCGATFLAYPGEVEKGKGRFCSFSCRNSSLFSGEDSPRWKGGVKIEKGKYRLIYTPGHPNANCQGYVREHRLVVEESIGRILSPKEVVHHIDSDTLNNKISNLQVFKNNEEHMRHHAKLRHGKTNINQEGRALRASL